MNFCLGKLTLELLVRIGKWHQNLSEKTGSVWMAVKMYEDGASN